MDNFIAIINNHFRQATQKGWTNIVLNSGNIHREAGGYPGPNHRMPACCNAMRLLVRPGDETISEPPSGNGASLEIRYKLPRL